MKNYGLMLLATAFLFGCASAEQAPDNYVAESEASALANKIESRQIKSECAEPTEVKESCGLISLNALADYRDFAKKHCSGKHKSKLCKDDFNKMIAAKWQLRYTLSDDKKVIAIVNADPDKYDTLASRELELLKSHNEGIANLVIKEEMEKREEQERIEQAQYENKMRRLQVIHSMSNSFKSSFQPIQPYMMPIGR